jgi:hypothetical protein
VKKWSLKDDERLKALYHTMPNKELEKIFERTHRAIRQHAFVLGITHQCNVNHEYFSSFNNKGMPWVLGMFATDGCACAQESRQSVLNFSQKQKFPLETIKLLLNSTHKISPHKRGYWQLSFASEQMYKDLCSIFGHDVQRKSNVLAYPQLSDKHQKDFIRGCIDGDGSLKFHYDVPVIEFGSASRIFAYGLWHTVEFYTGIVGNVHERIDKKFYQVCYVGIKAKCLARWLYDNAIYFVESKKQLANNFQDWHGAWIRKSSLTPKMCQLFQL